MRIASLAEVKAKLSAYLRIVERTGPVVITRNGRAVAILVAPVDDDDLERLLLARSPRFKSLLATSRASIRGGKGVTHTDFWKAAVSNGLPSHRGRAKLREVGSKRRRPQRVRSRRHGGTSKRVEPGR